MGHVEISDLVAKLQTLESVDAWKGTASVWTNHGNIIEHREQCLIGIKNGLQQQDNVAAEVARKLASLFQKSYEPTVYFPVDIIDLYFLVLGKKNGCDRNELYDFDD